MNRTSVALIGLMVASPICAQDFIQQWRDSAIVAMNAFRTGHWAQIKAQGWQFVGGAETSEGIPSSDVFIRDVKIPNGPIRSADVLNVSYLPLQVSDLPEFQSSKALIWFNCTEGSYEHRSVERYASTDGSGNPVSSDTKKAGSASMELKGAELLSMEKPLLAAVCSAKP